jgi:hypothetical protein
MTRVVVAGGVAHRAGVDRDGVAGAAGEVGRRVDGDRAALEQHLARIGHGDRARIALVRRAG